MGMPERQAHVLYPPTVVSYAIARWGLGNEYYTFEVFAAMHLLAGYLASFAGGQNGRASARVGIRTGNFVSRSPVISCS